MEENEIQPQTQSEYVEDEESSGGLVIDNEYQDAPDVGDENEHIEFAQFNDDYEYHPLPENDEDKEEPIQPDYEHLKVDTEEHGLWGEFHNYLIANSNRYAEAARIKAEIDRVIQEMRDNPYKNEPVTVEWLARFWNTAWWNPITRGFCKKIDFKVKVALTTATAGWHWALFFIKFKYPFNTVGALLELFDGPLGEIGFIVTPKGLLNLILGLPGIQDMLRFLRRLLYPILRSTAFAYRKNLAQKKIDRLVMALYQQQRRQ
ncbi:MAG: hypothetical protein FWC00_00950 [Firmicutes bacterium]|nr:hypothetical protein [Bacillota bacterium]